MVTDLRNQLQQSLGEAYRLERELGGGGMSRVFLAVETALGRQVVVKVLLPELAAGVSVDRFHREIQLAAQLSHPHIVPLLAAGDAGGLPWFTMPYVTGESLRNRLLRDGELPVIDTIRILRDVASALAYAHAQSVVHRDIKPDNVLLSHGVAVVTDFGVAKALTASADHALHTGLTSMGVTLGTPAYMAPEQASADPGLDHRVDVYAYGIMAYEILTGQTPFHGRSPSAMLGAHMAAIPEPVTARRPGIPPLLAHLVMKCLEKRPADRPQTASELIATIDMLTTPSGGTVPLKAVSSGGMATVVTDGQAQRRTGAEAQGRGAGARRMGAVVGALIVAAGAVVWVGRSGGARDAAPPAQEVPSPPQPPVAAPAAETATAPDQHDTTSAASGAAPERPSARAPVRPSAPTNPDESAMLARLRSEALAARVRAAAAGASEEALARGDATLAAGDSLRTARKTVGAAARFSSATTLWSDAADAAVRTAAAPETTPSPAVAPSPPAAPAPTPPSAAAAAPSTPALPRTSTPAPPSDPAPAIRALFAEYAQAIESRSIPAIRRVYPGLSPAQSKEWEDFFGAVDAIDVDLSVSDLAVSGDSADARLSGVYVFQNPGTHRTQREPVSFQARLRRMGGEWRIEVLR